MKNILLSVILLISINYPMVKAESEVKLTLKVRVIGRNPRKVVFRANAYDPDGEIASYDWDFDGDGNYDTALLDSTVMYFYNTAGSYVVKLRVTDDEGAEAFKTTMVDVLPDNIPPEIIELKIQE